MLFILINENRYNFLFLFLKLVHFWPNKQYSFGNKVCKFIDLVVPAAPQGDQPLTIKHLELSASNCSGTEPSWLNPGAPSL